MIAKIKRGVIWSVVLGMLGVLCAMDVSVAYANDELKARCDQGDGWVCLVLGWRYEHGGDVIKVNEKKAVKYYKKACDLYEGVGCAGLGVMYEFGRGVKRNKKQALEYYGTACNLKSERGCEHLARLRK